MRENAIVFNHLGEDEIQPPSKTATTMTMKQSIYFFPVGGVRRSLEVNVSHPNVRKKGLKEEKGKMKRNAVGLVRLASSGKQKKPVKCSFEKENVTTNG